MPRYDGGMTLSEFRDYVSGEKDTFRRSCNDVIAKLIEWGEARATITDGGEVEVKLLR